MEWYGKEQEKIRSYLVGMAQKRIGEGMEGMEIERGRTIDREWYLVEIVCT